MFNWFDQRWKAACKAEEIRAAYAARFDELVSTTPPIIDGDTLPMRVARAWTAERLRKVRTANHLWMDVTKLHENRGKGRAGNQLMMTPMTRVFFGFPAADLSTDTAIGHVPIRYLTTVSASRSLRFSNNSMDVLSLPVPGAGGPSSYDFQSLLFTRKVEKGTTIFELSIGSKTQRKSWEAKSKKAGGHFQMQSGREWGVFT